jgi:hypothetical protein
MGPAYVEHRIEEELRSQPYLSFGVQPTCDHGRQVAAGTITHYREPRAAVGVGADELRSLSYCRESLIQASRELVLRREEVVD